MGTSRMDENGRKEKGMGKVERKGEWRGRREIGEREGEGKEKERGGGRGRRRRREWGMGGEGEGKERGNEG